MLPEFRLVIERKGKRHLAFLSPCSECCICSVERAVLSVCAVHVPGNVGFMAWSDQPDCGLTLACSFNRASDSQSELIECRSVSPPLHSGLALLSANTGQDVQFVHM